MKFGILGDLHSRISNPVNRKDDYERAFWTKMEYTFDTFTDEDVDFVLQPGDFFDNYGRDPFDLVYDMMMFLKKYNIPVNTIYGQHDLRFHNLEYLKTPLNMLHHSDCVNIIKHQVIYPSDNTPIIVSGASFGQDIPAVTELRDSINILLIHTMVIKKKKLWTDQTDFIKSNTLLNNTGYDIIVSGDNHQGFMIKNKSGQLLFNCGSLMRTNIDQVTHKPRFYIYDTQTKNYTQYDIPIDAPEDVFRLDKKMEKDAHDIELDDFTTALNVKFKNQFSFKNNLTTIIKKNDVHARSKAYIDDAVQ